MSNGTSYLSAGNMVCMAFFVLQTLLTAAVGMAFAPWNMFRAGRLRTDAEEEAREREGTKGRMGRNPDWKRNDLERKMAGVLEKVAGDVGAKDIRAGTLAPSSSHIC